MEFSMRQAARGDARVVSSILIEAALWQEKSGHPAWQPGTISEQEVASQIDLFFLAEAAHEPAGTLKFQTDDRIFWPDHSEENAAYVHKVAVRRKFAGGKLSHSLLAWSVDRARMLEKKFLRLDCDAKSPKLRGVYENFGFVYHSDKSMGSFVVARYQYKI